MFVKEPEIELNSNCHKMYRKAPPIGRKRNIEEEDFLQDLQNRFSKLQKEHNVLQKKYKSAVAAARKFKNEIQTLRRRFSGGPTLSNDGNYNFGGGCNKGVILSSRRSQHGSSNNSESKIFQMERLLIDSEQRIQEIYNEKEKLLKENVDLLEKYHIVNDINLSNQAKIEALQEFRAQNQFDCLQKSKEEEVCLSLFIQDTFVG